MDFLIFLPQSGIEPKILSFKNLWNEPNKSEVQFDNQNSVKKNCMSAVEFYDYAMYNATIISGARISLEIIYGRLN